MRRFTGARLGGGIALSMAAMLSACDGSKGATDSTKSAIDSTPSVAADDSTVATEADFAPLDVRMTSCKVNGSSAAARCLGYFGMSFTSDNYEPLAKAIETVHDVSTNWTNPGNFTDHTPLNSAGGPARYRMSALTDGDKIPFKDVHQDGVVVARIEVDIRSPEDRRYGISDGGPTMSRFYYLVVSDFDNLPYHDYKGGLRIATYSVFGVRLTANGKYDRLVPIRTVKGGFRICKRPHEHPPSAKKTGFRTCPGARSYFDGAQALGSTDAIDRVLEEMWKLHPPGSVYSDTALVQQDLERIVGSSSPSFSRLTAAQRREVAASIMKIRDDELDAPAWLRCAAGCCTAEDE